MNESVCSRSKLRERCKDSMEHDLAVKICLLLNHSFSSAVFGTCDLLCTKNTLVLCVFLYSSFISDLGQSEKPRNGLLFN